MMKMKKLSMKLMLLLVLVVIGVLYSPKQEAFAATPVQVCAVSYEDESILVFINGNSKIYFATDIDASKNNWDVIDVNSTDKIAVIDISWLSPNVENIMMIKGDVNQTQARITLLEKPVKLEVSINYNSLDGLASSDTIGSLLNIMTTESTGTRPILFDDLQWKKGDTGQWMSAVYLKKDLLESYLVKGTNLYFRIAPIDDVVSTELGGSDYYNYTGTYAYTKPYFDFDMTITANMLTFGTDYPDGTEGRRASDEIKLKIAKKSTLPVTGIDGEEFTAEIKYGQEYRITRTVGTVTTTDLEWTKVTDRLVKRISLKTMLKGTYDGLTNAFPEMLIEIRNYSTSKASSSKIIKTSLNAQRVLAGSILQEAAPVGVTASDPNIYITYNGTKNMNIQIPSASENNPYEYCVVKQGYTFDLEKASWTAISKSTVVKILATKAVDYSTIYIRMKEVKYRAETESSPAVAYKLASTLKTFPVNYPSIPTATKATHIFTKGYPTTITIEVTLNVAGKMPFETGLKYIKLGTKDVPVQSVVVTPAITGTIDPTKVYKMVITLKNADLETMVNCTARALSIYYNNGTVDKTSSKLTIKSPTAALSLTTTTAIGTVTGSTAVTVVNPIGTNNHLVYLEGPTAITGMNMEDKFTSGKAFTNGMNIPMTAGQYLTIYEIDSNGFIQKYKSIQITAANIM
jgi:hypothetical protein